jgi:hypothetical protein
MLDMSANTLSLGMIGRNGPAPNTLALRACQFNIRSKTLVYVPFYGKQLPASPHLCDLAHRLISFRSGSTQIRSKGNTRGQALAETQDR